jgi:aspartokinase
MISMNEIKISVVIDLAKGEQAVQAVHAAFIS